MHFAVDQFFFSFSIKDDKILTQFVIHYKSRCHHNAVWNTMYYKLRCNSTQFVIYYKLRNYYKLQRNKGGQCWPWPMIPQNKINRVRPLIMITLHMKFETDTENDIQNSNGIYTPTLILIALFAVAEGWLLLDIGWFVLFFELFLIEEHCMKEV